MLSLRAAAGRGGGGGGKRTTSSKTKKKADPAGAPARNRRPTKHSASQADLLADAASRIAASARAARATAAARERAAEEAAALGAIAAVAAGRASVRGGVQGATSRTTTTAPPSFPLITPELATEALLKHAGGPVPAMQLASPDPTTSQKRVTRARGARKSAERALLAAHQTTLTAALASELEVERAETLARLRDWPQARLAAAGAALFGLTISRAGALFGDPLLRLSLARPGALLPFHAFTPGDAVLMTPPGGTVSGLFDGDGGGTEGVLLDYSTTWLRVAVSPAAAARILGSASSTANRQRPSATSPIASGGWRLDLHVSQTPHDRCVAALADFCNPAPPTRTPEDGACAGLRRALASGAGGPTTPVAAEAAAAILPPWATGGAAKPARAAAAADLRSPVAGLNPSQAAAAVAALSRTLTLWQGPPGTGKTRTLAALLTAVVRRSVLKPPSRHAAPDPHATAGGGREAANDPSPSNPASSASPRPVPILVTAASNIAVDNLVRALVEASSLDAQQPPLRIVRVGPPAKASPDLRHLTLAALIADSPTGKLAAASRARAASSGGPAARAERERAAQLQEAAAARVLGRAHVVAATCIGAGDPTLAALSFGLVALDEASQATEPAALVALLRRCRAAVLVGDPAQLPPTVVSQDALSAGLGVSLFERAAAAGVATALLDTQYRMHPAISAFPSARFYGSKLLDGVGGRERAPPRSFPWPDARSPVAFISVEGGVEVRAGGVGFHTSDGGGGGPDARSPDAGGSYANAAEVAAVLAAARLLVMGSGGGGGSGPPSAVLHPDSIGVITPYAGQARALRLALDAAGSPALAAVEVRTVDGFQGREKEVILFSAVRSNPAGRVGFLADARRLNVALTRARRGLIVVGARHTLASDPHWRAWLRWVDERGLVLRRGGSGGGGGGAGEAVWAAVDAAVEKEGRRGGRRESQVL